jgi:hypothetical protein
MGINDFRNTTAKQIHHLTQLQNFLESKKFFDFLTGCSQTYLPPKVGKFDLCANLQKANLIFQGAYTGTV